MPNDPIVDRILTSLRAAIEEALPKEKAWGRIQLDDRPDYDFADFSMVLQALSLRDADAVLDGEVVVALAKRFGDSRQIPDEQRTAFRAALANHADRIWPSLEPLLLERLRHDHYYGNLLFDVFPRLRTSKRLLNEIVDGLGSTVNRHNADRLAPHIRITSVQDARSILVAFENLDSSRHDDLVLPFVVAIGDGLGWTPWAKLMAILFGRPKFGDLSFRPTLDGLAGGNENARAMHAVAAAVCSEKPIRAAAGRLLELDSSMRLSDMPPESRAAYVALLADIVGDDAELRRAVIEALLWLPQYNDQELGQFAAIKIVKAADQDWLTDLIDHPKHQVGYAAFAIREAAFGTRADVSTDYPGTTQLGLTVGLARLGLTSPIPTEEPCTWLGDRMVERLIEQVADSVEREMAAEFEDHCGEGEEALLTIFFERLSGRMRQLDDVFTAAARSFGTRHVSLQFRRIDKPEEGSKGVRGAQKFAADVCLIVNPVFQGKSLGKRASIVQAKRLYGDFERSPIRWHASYEVKLEQIENLLEQSNSSFHLFQGPLNFGRGLPVIPTLLVKQLAAAHSGTGQYVGVKAVGMASRGFADWLTYDVLALRVGDPLEELIAKAEGVSGRKARTLLDLPRVEIDLSVTDKVKPE